MAVNKCAHPRCRLMKLRSQYACRSHWFGLPKGIQRAICRGYAGLGDWNAAHKEAQKFWGEVP